MIILTIPFLTDYCVHEVGKNKLRMKLTEDNLDYTPRIMLEGDCLEEMDFTQLLGIWNKQGLKMLQ